MRQTAARRRMVRAVAVSASVLLLAACGKASWQPAVANPTGTGAPPGPAYAVGTALISNGSNTVIVGGATVTFPTTVTDAAWSPDGSRIAFVNGDGNIATARPDGSGLVILTAPVKGVTRARPAWQGRDVFYEQTGPDGKKRIFGVYPPGFRPDGKAEYAYSGSSGVPITGLTAPTGTAVQGQGFEFGYARQGSQGSEIWVVDQNQREPRPVKVATGNEPALSPDGLRLAFVDAQGHIDVIALRPTGTAKPAQVSFGATGPSHLEWTPDGTRIAYTTGTGIESVAATVAAGATANPAQEISSRPGVVTFLGNPTDTVVQVNGADPVDAAINASQTMWGPYVAAGPNSPPSAVSIAAATDTVESCAGGYGPLLFTSGPTLDQRVGAELRRIYGPAEEIDPATQAYILGGPGAVSAQAEQTLRDLGLQTRRAPIAPTHFTYDTVIVVSESDPALLAAARGFGRAKTFVITGSTLSAAAQSYLKGSTKNDTIYAVGAGAQAALAASWSGKPAGLKPIALVGATPGATAVLLYTAFAPQTSRIVVADRRSPADVAIAMSMSCDTPAEPFVLLDGTTPLDPAIRGWLDALAPQIDTVYIVDWAGKVSPPTVSAFAATVSGPLGHATVTNPKAKPDHLAG